MDLSQKQSKGKYQGSYINLLEKIGTFLSFFLKKKIVISHSSMVIPEKWETRSIHSARVLSAWVNF